MICTYCNNSFKSKTILFNHQKTAKYCIELQKLKQKKPTNFNCEYCYSNLSSKQRLRTHLNTCNIAKQIRQKDREILRLNEIIKDKENENIKLNNIIKDKEDIILQLKTKSDNEREQKQIYKDMLQDSNQNIVDIAKKPQYVVSNTNNNNTINNLGILDLSEDKLKNTIDEHYNINYMIEGQKGAANFAYDKLLKDADGNLLITCADSSRDIYKFKDNNGDIIKDVKAVKLTDKISKNLYDKHTATTKTYKGHILMDTMIEKNEELRALKNRDNKAFRAALTTLIV